MILDQAQQFRDRIIAGDAAALEKLVSTYSGISRRVQAEIEALLAKIESGEITKSGLARLPQYQRLLKTIKIELQYYSGYMTVEMRAAAQALIADGITDSRKLVISVLEQYGVSASLLAEFRLLNPAALEQLIPFLDQGSVLWQKVNILPDWTVDRVAQAILEGVSLGKNPRDIAGVIEYALGEGLTQAMRMMRTLQLWAYREATRANYIANSDIVKGWIWWAYLDMATCGSCIAMHGSEHSNSEVLNDHYNGRCTMLPLVVGLERGDLVDQTGQEWFSKLSDADQRQILGAGKYDAWKNGLFDFSRLSQEHDDDVYGIMRAEASLKDLIGGNE